MTIFRAYDIRGIYTDELDEGIAYLIGRAIATWSKAATILVGRDMRTSSVPLREALVRGITDQGADVLDIGLCSTPLFYWATQEHAAGVMVTASHNPAQYNGFKVCKDGARPVGGDSGLQEIEALVLSQEFPASEKKGTITQIDVLEDYLAFAKGFLKTERTLKIVVDAANGMGGYTYGALMERLPKNLEIVPLYFELDGSFPNHEANPLKYDTLEAIKAKIAEVGADLGAALDGDADRILFLTEKGEPIPNDITTALIARQILQEQPGATILYDVRSSWVTPEEIAAAGGRSIVTRVGHAFIKQAMREHHAAFGGELSGHFYNAEQQNTENTMIVFFRLLNLLGDKTLSEVAGPLMTRYPKIEETNFEVADPHAAIERIEAQYQDTAKTIVHVDGTRVEFDDWWFNLRASNTEPLLRLNMEAKTKEVLDQKKKELEERIRELVVV